MLGCMPNSKGIGRFCSLEGKLDYNDLSALQVAHRNDVIKSGGLSMGIKTMDDVDLIIHRAKTDYIQDFTKEKKQLKQYTL